ncbi:MAG TPA: choice-of-anchor Q domain-containing protein [Gemmatimonadales bacterium]|jgi:hypothetical protein|nr:choice-of-anchor Q domain-containing protein [Gemmatimonadales bacterium]
MRFAAPRARVRLTIASAALATLAGCTDRQPEPTGIPRSLASSRTVTGTTVTVTNTADAGSGSLRDAIGNAADGATIVFDPTIAGQTITLTSGEILIHSSLTIAGPSTNGVTISGGGHSHVFQIQGPLVDGVVTMRNLTITGGYTDGQAGGIEHDNMTLVLEYVLIKGNYGGHYGGGIFSSGPLVVTNSTIAGNTAFQGGGIMNTRDMSLNNVTIVGNNAPTRGGGVYVSNMFQDNLRADIHNSIIAGNTSPNGPNCSQDLPYSVTGTNIADDLSCGPPGPNMIVADPMLGALADNAGPTKTMAVLRGSPAIDAATDCTVTDDQRHVARPLGAACDIGAYEFDNYVKTTLSVDASVVVNPNTGTAAVTGAFGCSEPASVLLHVTLSEPQKVGKVPAVVAATDSIPLTCTSGSKAWSVALTPPTGAFSNGNGTVTVNTDHESAYVLPQSASASVKLYWGHK